MILKVGTYDLQVRRTKLSWEWTPVVSKRGYLMYRRLVSNFSGTVSDPSSLAALETLIEDTETAAKAVDVDFGLYLPDGTTPTKHVVASSSTMDGTRIRFSWLEGQGRGVRGNGVEYLAYRSFRGQMSCEIADCEEEIVEWSETIRQIGTGGAEFVVKESIPTSPIVQALQAASSVVLIQEGYAVGWSDWPAFPAAYNSGTALRAKPAVYERLAPIYGRNLTRLHPIRWKYLHELTSAPGSPVTPTSPP